MRWKEQFAEARRRFDLLSFYGKFEHIVIFILTVLIAAARRNRSNDALPTLPASYSEGSAASDGLAHVRGSGDSLPIDQGLPSR